MNARREQPGLTGRSVLLPPLIVRLVVIVPPAPGGVGSSLQALHFAILDVGITAHDVGAVGVAFAGQRLVQEAYLSGPKVPIAVIVMPTELGISRRNHLAGMGYPAFEHKWVIRDKIGRRKAAQTKAGVCVP